MLQPLVSWFEENQRPLPWRATYDPYHVWVSEVMLQQTQVETALPYYERFIREFPTIQSLALAGQLIKAPAYPDAVVAREKQRAGDSDIGRLAFPSFLRSIATPSSKHFSATTPRSALSSLGNRQRSTPRMEQHW